MENGMRALIIVCCLLFAVGAVGTPALAAEQITADPAVVTLVNKSTELIKAGKKAEAIAELEKALTHKLAPQAESNVLTRLAIMLSEDPKAFDYLTRARQLPRTRWCFYLSRSIISYARSTTRASTRSSSSWRQSRTVRARQPPPAS
jgi:hypothetical protein